MTIQETLRHLEKGFIEWLTEFNPFVEGRQQIGHFEKIYEINNAS